MTDRQAQLRLRFPRLTPDVKKLFALAIPGAIAGSGQISKTGSGQLVISNSVLVATIQSNSVSLDFATPPADGPYAVLSGPLDSASLATTRWALAHCLEAPWPSEMATMDRLALGGG
jgi:hypothetical protein